MNELKALDHSIYTDNNYKKTTRRINQDNENRRKEIIERLRMKKSTQLKPT